MKVMYVFVFCVMTNFSMDMDELNRIMILEENAKCILDHERFTPVADIHKIGDPSLKEFIEIDIVMPKEHEEREPLKWFECSKTKALVIGSIITAGSVSLVAIITAITTVIVAIIKK